MTAQEIETNSLQMIAALTTVHGDLMAEGNFAAAAAIFRVTQDADMVTLAKLAMVFKAAVK